MQELADDRAMLVLVRHGQSEWNFANRFIGWYDSPLTEEGEWEAEEAGRLLKDRNIEVDEVHTSTLDRSIKTAKIAMRVMREAGLEVPTNREVRSTWRLNERSYGALTGRNKKECAREFGKDQLKIYRRSWDVPPPPYKEGSEEYTQVTEAFECKVESLSSRGSYDNVADPPPSELPKAESLKCTQERMLPYYRDVILPQLQEGKRVMVFGHENNLRALIKHLDDINHDDILEVDLPRAMPLVYVFERHELVDPQMSALQAPRLKPLKLTPPDAAMGAQLLSSRYLVDQELITAFRKRDVMNVYETDVEENLEEVCPIDEDDDMCEVIGEYLHDPSEESSDRLLVGEPVIVNKRGEKKDRKPSTTGSTAFLAATGACPPSLRAHSLCQPTGGTLVRGAQEEAPFEGARGSDPYMYGRFALALASYLCVRRRRSLTTMRARNPNVSVSSTKTANDVEKARKAMNWHIDEDALPSYFPAHHVVHEQTDHLDADAVHDDSEEQEICELIGLDMGDKLDRQISKRFSEKERDKAYTLSGMLDAKPSDKPSCIWLIGPSACGKSTLAMGIASWVGMDMEGYVTIDGEHFRDSHDGYQAALEAGQQNGCVWWGAYVGIRENVNKEKQALLEKAADERKNLMIPSTCLRRSQCIDVAKMLHEKGYLIHVVGVYGDKDTIVKRGQRRAMEQGKRYDPREFEIALTMFAPMLRLCTGKYRMVCTTAPKDDMKHRISSEGEGPLDEDEVHDACTTSFKALLGEDAYESA